MRVLLATDGSKDARTATVYLRDFPLPEGSRILLLSVVDAPASPLDVPPVREFRAALRAEGRRALEEARRLLGPRGATAEDRVAEGGARAEILRAADEWEADLIVLGARGLGGVRGVLLGSVSSAVAHHARCPVLVVKGRPRPLGGVLIALDGSEHAWAGVRFVLALAPTVAAARVARHLDGAGGVVPVTGRTHAVMRAADLVLVTSGTATLEAALLGTPMVVCYRVSRPTALMVSLLVRVPWMSLVNLTLGRAVVPELYQASATGERLATEALGLLDTPGALDGQRGAFRELAGRLGEPGVGVRAARLVLAEARAAP